MLRQLFEKIEDGDLSEWPLTPGAARQVVRVSFTRGPESLLSKFKELKVRSRIVKQLAYIYIENHVQDLADRLGILKIHAYERCASVAASLKQHADRRVNFHYPPEQHDTDTGALLPGLADVLAEQRELIRLKACHSPETLSPLQSAFDMKQSTMHDSARSEEHLFEHVRPTIVTDESESADTYAPEVVLEQGFGNIPNMKIPMSNQFEDQFISKYLPRIFPWVLNYDCGGPEFPGLFENWDNLIENQNELLARGLQQRWRKLAQEAALVPGGYAQMLATRPEMQVAGNWPYSLNHNLHAYTMVVHLFLFNLVLHK